jgi:glyoxylase-like metal-dependent hydrolase (beta-lactamase superfamily II)
MRRRGWLRVVAPCVVAGVIAALLGLPWLSAEFGLRYPGPLVGPHPEGAANGRWVDDYWLVEQIDADTWAIGEPRYYQGNYSYLLLGAERALLFDGGPGVRDIAPLVRSLTSLPVTVLASHLHFDHVGALGRLDRAAIIDLAELRARAADGTLALRRYEYLGFVDGLPPRRIAVDEWLQPGAEIDLGGRRVELLHVPGHTPDSVALHEPQRHRLFAGDFVYPSELYAFLPGASRADYLHSTQSLLSRIAPDTRIYTAHLGDTSAGIAAPRLAVADLEALVVTLVAVASGEARAEGLYPRVYPVRGDIVLATGLQWNNR